MLPPGQFEEEKLRVLNISSVPEIDADDYMLRIGGCVDSELELSYGDLLEMRQVEVEIPAHCVEGWSVTGLKWGGVPVEEIISLSRPAEAKFVLLKCIDGYTTCVSLDYFQRGIFALRLNGQTIPPEHGYPVRAVIPDLYFWKSAKWVGEVEFLEEYVDGYWESRGYHSVGDAWLEQRRK
ncbi:molybdopterin-dependent oxidoreductase [Geoglobus acetivorans]|uniref:Oxidoreductase molybdopterin-binding domain-containing protein n=1 Tax=Geoglobus acetivorans TaxID=565033 RepID=A0A0A7GF57_GEOAI|nr:hypothetical protein GACE_0519 [Geoglobus acetivorans]